MTKGCAQLRLQHVLDSFDLKQADLVRFLAERGRSMSKTSLSRIIKSDSWPKRIDTEQVKTLIEEFLTAHQVPSRALTGIWQSSTPAQTNKPEEIDPTEEEEFEMLKPEARAYFKFNRDPFENEIDCLEDIYLSSDMRRHLEELEACARSSSIVALVAECGAGKSVLRRLYTHRVKEQDSDLIIIEPARINKKKITAESLSQAICRALQIKTGGMSGEDRDAAMTEALLQSAYNGHRHLLIIDEAHSLSLEVLKLLKCIWDLTAGFTHVVGIALFGQPELKHKRLVGDNIREFSRRCQTIEVQPLGREQLIEYVEHKFKRAGVDVHDIFDDEALRCIFGMCQAQVSRHLNERALVNRQHPMEVNRILAKALNYASDIKEKRIDERMMREVRKL